MDHQINRLLLDLDGTVYMGGVIIPGVPEALYKWANAGNEIVFITNNTSKTKTEHVLRLKSLGLPAEMNNVITPVAPTANRLRDLGISSAYILGTSAVVEEFNELGIVHSEAKPDSVIVTFDKELTFKKLDYASRLINSGVPYYATHPDFFCPTEYGPIPDCGSFIKMLEEVTGISPLEVFGKPSNSLVEIIQSEYSQGSVLVGDRLHTDILTGINAGIPTCLVLTGETTVETLEESPHKPTFIFNTLPDLIGSLL